MTINPDGEALEYHGKWYTWGDLSGIVLEACVVSLPDPRLGQVPVAGFRLKAGKTLSGDELRAFLRERLAAHQVPTQLRQVDDFVRTPSMKASQPELRKLFEAA